MTGPLTTLDLRGTDTSDPHALRSVLPRPKAAEEPPIEQVRAVIERVREGGDDALREMTKEFDRVDIDTIQVDPDDVARAVERIPPALRTALETAHTNIAAYHRAQLHDPARYERDGLLVRELRRPVDRAGLYVPSALAPLLSTALMTAVPAKVVGPGSARVAQAKREVASSGLVGVPSSFAGPSEVVVIADRHAVVEDVAIDIVLQAEHGPDGLAWLICWDDDVRAAVDIAVGRIVADSPRRSHIEATLADAGYAVVVDGPTAAVDVANVIAPEHLELQVADPEDLLVRVKHAGAVFCGPWAPASVGDYAAGPNHVLPTYGSARFSGALRVDDFCKHVHVVTLDEGALRTLAPHVEAMAEAEGLAAHADSVRQRVDRLAR